jgi:tetratricopeptide (TPR) repeat protein
VRIEGIRIPRYPESGGGLLPTAFFLSATLGTAVIAALALATSLAVSQDTHQPAAPPATSSVLEVAKRPVPLRNGIGAAHDAVATTSKQAQAFYDQGLAYLHSYVWLEAARSFNRALVLDPNLAIGHAQLSLAYTELNAPAAAKSALERANALASRANDHDRRHIALRGKQMEAELAGSGSSRMPQAGTKLAAYRQALDEALKLFPGDEEIWLLRGMAESTDPAERGQGSVAASIPFYDKAHQLAPTHVGADHYLAHAYENTGRLDLAITHGAAYAATAPAIPHAHHMRGHDLMRSGRMPDAIGEFQAADALESAHFAAEKIPAALDWHYQHNLDLLGQAYQYTGQMAKAEAAFKRSFAMTSSLVVQEFNKREWIGFLLARGRAAEALEAATVMASHRSPLVSAAGHVQAGHAKLALGQYKAAADEGNAALHLIQGVEGGGLIAVPLQTFQAEFFLRTKQIDKARPALEDAARKARLQTGPDNFMQTLFTLEAMARVARESGEWDLAGWAARQMIAHDSNYAGSHYALALVAQHAGDARITAAEFALAAKYWSTADADLAELKSIRQGR